MIPRENAPVLPDHWLARTDLGNRNGLDNPFVMDIVKKAKKTFLSFTRRHPDLVLATIAAVWAATPLMLISWPENKSDNPTFPPIEVKCGQDLGGITTYRTFVSNNYFTVSQAMHVEISPEAFASSNNLDFVLGQDGDPICPAVRISVENRGDHIIFSYGKTQGLSALDSPNDKARFTTSAPLSFLWNT